METTDPGNLPIGVAKMSAMSSHLSRWFRVAIFASIFLVGFAYGLASTLTGVYQAYATASFKAHSLLATSNTLRVVFAIAAQPAAAKLTDVLGRLEIIWLCALFFVAGLIVQATSNGVVSFVAGAVLQQVGLSTTQVMVEVIVADLSSTRLRLFCYTIPNVHFIFTIWLSGDISASMLSHSSWRWGIGMWPIVYVACLIPFVVVFKLGERSARKNGAPVLKADWRMVLKQLFWQIDAVGLVLVMAILALILAPVSLAGGVSSKWESPSIIAPIVVGVVLVPVFVFWEMRAPHPLLPFEHMRDRSVWGALGVGAFFNFAVAMQRGFLYTVLVVAFDFSVKEATRISTVYSFMPFVCGPLVGLAVYRVRRLRPFILFGVVVFTVAFGLLVRYRGGQGTENKAGVVAGQVLLGLGASFFGFAVTVAMQVTLKHEHVAVMIALFFSFQLIGNALGNSVSGSIWSQVLPQQLTERIGNQTQAMQVFANPFVMAAQFPVGTPTRSAIVESYQRVQRILCAVGLGLCLPTIAFAAVIRNPELNDEQTLAVSDEDKRAGHFHSGASTVEQK
ncbi:major facilitator superfamily transporter [Colletotrichum plurivorum]|uniref:Major facilitator superfamily transporter n=1 Tax=Colletotrichum plurivorum TaxID=2175906 RepID=A0A8H6KIV7_9PEZI|nr:major facilitator superfamily transporter [Colletotrichum plurivorum]